MAMLSNKADLSGLMTASLGGIQATVALNPSLDSDDTVSLTVRLSLRFLEFTTDQQRKLKDALANAVNDPSLISTHQILLTDFRELSAHMTQISVTLDPDPNQNFDVVCPLTAAQRLAVDKDCGAPRTCACIADAILAEQNPRICAEYAAVDSLLRNGVVNCARRDCDEYQVALVLLLLLGGGFLGGAYLFCANGCSFRPMDEDEISEGEALEQQAAEVVEDRVKPEEEAEEELDLAADVDCCDGIDDGEVGTPPLFPPPPPTPHPFPSFESLLLRLAHRLSRLTPRALCLSLSYRRSIAL